jgi:hypothetical protein
MDTSKAIVLVALIIGAVVFGIFIFSRCDSQKADIASLPKLVASAATEGEVETTAPPVCEKGKCKGVKTVVAECCFNSECDKGQVCIDGQCKGPWKAKKAEPAPTTTTITVTQIVCPNGQIVADASQCPQPAPKKKSLLGECKVVASGWMCATEL